MHFEFLVEDASGEAFLKRIIPMILDDTHTWEFHSYKGVGHIPRKGQSASLPDRRILLDQLPRLIQGYGNKWHKQRFHAAVIVVCDLDDNCLKAFLDELLAVLANCQPAPITRFCIAIEEGEAWLLGDRPAIQAAYPRAKNAVLEKYVNDSICGTWEKLADALYPEGAKKLKMQGEQKVGEEKSRWAERITPHMNVEANNSPSFVHFRDKIRELAETAPHA